MSKSVLAKTSTQEIQLTITIPAAEIQEALEKVIEETTKETTVPGFRKGKAPKKVVEEKLDKSKLYETVLQRVVPQAYIQAINEHQLKPIIQPRVELLKAKEDEDWEVRATTAEKPEINLGDYQSLIKSKVSSPKIWTPDQKAEKEKNHGEEHDHDEEVQKIMETLVTNMEITLPSILVEDELNRALSNLINQTEKLGMTVDQYLASTGKTPESLRAEYRQQIEKDLKLQLILDAIAAKEKIMVEDKEVDDLVKATGDENFNQNLNTPEAKSYLKSIIARRKTLDFLAHIH